MLADLSHIKMIAFLGTMLHMTASHGKPVDRYSEEPHFHDDPVPGDSFPHYIFDKR